MAVITKKGIDVSTWQGNVDYKNVKASGIDFVIIRAGFGREVSQKDNMFEQNYKNAKAAGLDVGVYWYSYAESAADAVKESKACMSVIKGKKFEYPIYLDLEEQKQFAKGRSFCDGVIKAFCGELEKNGYYAGLYCSASPLTDYVSKEVAGGYALWVAQYNYKCTYSLNKYGMWQYSDNGKIGGISGSVDMNYCYVDYPSIIKSGGYNGYSKGSATVPTENKTSVGSANNTANKNSTNKNTSTNGIDVTYQVYANGRWLPKVKNLEDYAGLENCYIQGIRMKPSNGHLKYRVKLVGSKNYLPWVTDENDYAGIYGKNIDCVQISFTGVNGYNVQYRVSTVNGTNYLPWVTNYNNTNSDGYAGIVGTKIDKLQVRIIKK